MPDNIDSLQIEISANASKAEKSLNKLASSLGKIQSALSGIDSGRFQNLSSGILQLSNSMERFSSSVKTADFTRIATGLNKLSSVNVQGVSDASRAINTLTANLGNLGTIAFDSQGIANIANSVAQLGRKTVTQAADNIPKLTSSLGGLVSGLSGISSSSIDVSGLSQLTSSITKLGGKSATAAAGGNIDKLAESLKKMMTTLSTSPRVSQNLIQMTQALAQLASTGSKAGAATVNLSRSFGTLPTAANKAKTSFNGLASAIGKFYATYWLLIRALGSFKKAIDISSDLTEVQNVVDVSFGSMSDKMNEFADSALELYGMSELTAKQIGSRFQAMGVSMGFAQEDMTDMSIRLTQLAGDLASFYNITQDEAATKLQSIFTGESEPLRSLGIDLAQTSVEAWALSQGIDADMRSMTNAEKTMLRYQYVLASTGQATNDFQRTSDTWANSLRRLTGSFEQLGSIVGGVLINAFKPFVQALNSVMQAVISFAQVVSDALGAIFGWEYQTGGGVAQDLEMGAAAAEDIENATGGAADNAKKLKSYTLGIDELNILEPDDGSGSGSGGGGAGGAGGGADASGGEWVQTESLWEKYTSSIDSLYDLGDYIGNALTQAMNSIDWDSVYQSASNFGSGLASFLNGLISPELFGALGTTIAGALNTALYALNSFGTTFDWTNFGVSIATGINNFFSTFNFSNLANTINVWANGLLDALIAGLSTINWENIGTQIGTFLSEIDFAGIGAKIGKAIWEAINGGITLWKSAFNAAPVETAIITAIGALKFSGLGAALGNAMLKNLSVKTIVSSIGKLFSGNAISTVIAKAFSGSTIVTTISATMAETGASLSTVLFNLIAVPLKNFILVTIPGVITSAISSLGGIITGAIGSLATALGISVTAAGALVVAAVAAAIAAVVAVVLNWDEIKNFFTVTIPNWWNGTVMPFFQSIPQALLSVWESVKEYTMTKWNELLTFLSTVPSSIGKIIASIIEWFSQLPNQIGYALGYALGTIVSWVVNIATYLSTEIPEIISSVVEWFSELPGRIYDAIITFIDNVVDWAQSTYNTFNTYVNNIINNIINWFSTLPSRIYNAIITFINNVIQWATETYTTFNQKITEIITSIVAWFSEMPGKIYDTIIKFVENILKWKDEAIKTFRESVKEIVDKVVGFFGDLPDKMFSIGENVVKGLWNGINGTIGWLKDKISDFCDSVLEGFEDAFDIGSPSKVFAQEGRYLIQGIPIGISEETPGTLKTVRGFGERVVEALSSTFSNIRPVQISTAYQPIVPSYAGAISEYGVSYAGTISYTSDPTIEQNIGNLIDTKLIPVIQSANATRDELLQTIADKDTNTYIDGRKVNRILNNQQSRSGYSIRK